MQILLQQKSEMYWLKGVWVLASHFRSSIRGAEENFSWIIWLLQWNSHRYFELFEKTECSSTFRKYSEVTKPKVAQARKLFLFYNLRFQGLKQKQSGGLSQKWEAIFSCFFPRWDQWMSDAIWKYSVDSIFFLKTGRPPKLSFVKL